MSAVTVMVCVVNIRNMWLQGFFWINWISCPETVCTVLKEQFMCGLLDQSHDSLEASSVGSWISVSCSFDHIDVLSEGHLTGQSVEISLVKYYNLESSVCAVFNSKPITEFALVRQDGLVNTSNVHWDSVRHFGATSVVGVSPADSKDIGRMTVSGIGIKNSHVHGKIWLSRVTCGATLKEKSCVLTFKIWNLSNCVVLSGSVDGSVVATQIQIGLRVSEEDVFKQVWLNTSTT